MRKIFKLACGLVVFCVTVFIIVFCVLGTQQNIESYDFGEESITSINMVVGKRNVTSVSSSIDNGATIKTYTYKSDSVEADLDSYISSLAADGFVQVDVEGSSGISFTKDSTDDGKILILNMVSRSDGYILTIVKSVGEITYYDTE